MLASSSSLTSALPAPGAEAAVVASTSIADSAAHRQGAAAVDDDDELMDTAESKHKKRGRGSRPAHPAPVRRPHPPAPRSSKKHGKKG